MRRCDGPLWAIFLASTLFCCTAIWGGCKKKTPPSSQAKDDFQTTPQSQDPDAVTCHFSADSKRLLRRALSQANADHEARFFLMSTLTEECRGWPPLIAKAFELGAGAGAGTLAPSPALQDEATEVRASDREDMHRRLEKWCPGYAALVAGGDPGAQRASGTLGLDPEVWRKLWKVCQMDKDTLFTEKELVKNRPESLMVYVIFQSLRAGGLKAHVARLLARLWLPEDSNAMLARYKIALPEGRSTIAPLDVTDAVISSTQILLRNQIMATLAKGRTRAEDKIDGERGFFVTLLYRHLRDNAAQLDALARERGTTGGRWLTLAVDASTNFRLLSEVLYTAGQATFNRFQVILDNPEARAAVAVFELAHKEEGAQPPAFTDRIILRPTEIELQLGPKAVSQRIPLVEEGREGAFEALASKLQAHYSGSGQEPPASPSKPDPRAAPSSPAPVLHVEPTAEVGLQDIVHALLAVRSITKEPQAATSSGGLLTRGCPLRPNTGKDDYILDPKDQAAWMFPIPRLSLKGVMGKN